MQTASAFVASPHEIPVIELHRALKTGGVNGQDNGASAILKEKNLADWLGLSVPFRGASCGANGTIGIWNCTSMETIK